MKLVYLFILAGMLAVTAAAADVVVPVDKVAKHVNIRLQADAMSEVVGKLRKGESLPLDHRIPGWHVVKLAGDALGYVSADWSKVVTEDELAASTIDDQDPDDALAEEVEPAVADSVDIQADAQTEIDSEPDAVVADARATDPADRDSASGDDGVAVAGTAAEADAAPDVYGDTIEDATLAAATEIHAEEVNTDDAQLASESVEHVDGPAATVDVAPVVPTVPAPDTAVVEADADESPEPALPRSGSTAIEGTVDYLMKFTASTIGGNSQVYDDGRNVGIGTSEPKQRLEVNGNIQIHERNSNVAGLLLTQSSGDTGYIMHNRANSLTLGAGSVDRMTIDRDGNVGIGMARPSQPLEMASGAHVTAGGVWTNSSSREQKDNIVALTAEEAVATLEQLEPVRYHYKVDDREEYVGFIAEDVPELVATGDRKSLSPMDIVAVLTEVVQQQQERIAELESRLENSGL